MIHPFVRTNFASSNISATKSSLSSESSLTYVSCLPSLIYIVEAERYICNPSE